MLKIFKTYYSFVLRYKWRAAAFLVVFLIANTAWSLQPFFYKLFIDNIPRQNFHVLFRILGTYTAVRLIDLMASTGMFFFLDSVVVKAAKDARIAVVRKIQDLDFAYHLTRSTGNLISAIKRGDGAFFGMAHGINIQLAGVIFKFLFMVWAFSRIRFEVAAVMCISFLIALLIARYLVRVNIRTRLEFNDAEDVVSGIIVDNMINYETVKLFGKENQEIQRLDRAFIPWSKKFWAYSNSFRTIDITIGSLANISLFFVLLLSLIQVTHKGFTVGEFVFILGFVSSFYPQFFEMVYEFRNVAKQYADIETYFSVFDKEILVKDPVTPLQPDKVHGEISFEDVTFTYPEVKAPSLKNFNLKIRQGESVAFVGRSGVGKTTLVKLLMRFYDPEGGAILIDDVDIRDFTKSHLRSLIGVVPQEPVLFNDTIEFNIAYGADNATKREVEAAVKMANLDEFISSLPNKYQTMVGERGVKLSGGQKQRLAIARMILANPDIIVFDEATSQLDSESERLIQDAFWKVARDKTTIIIAHRLSTVVRADKIVVMEKGKIKEVGSHRALLNKKNGLYKKFWEMQVEAFD